MNERQRKMSGAAIKVLVGSGALLGAMATQAAEFSVGRVDIKFADEGWTEMPLPDQAQAFGGDRDGALSVQAKVFVREGSGGEAPVMVLVSANSAGLGGGRGGHMTYSTDCKSDANNFREGNEGVRTSFAQCLTVTPLYDGHALFKVLAPQIQDALPPSGQALPPFYAVWSRHAISTGSFLDVRVFTVFPIRADSASVADPVPKGVPPAHVVWGRHLKDAVKSSVYSLSGRLEIPPIRLEQPPSGGAAVGG